MDNTKASSLQWLKCPFKSTCGASLEKSNQHVQSVVQSMISVSHPNPAYIIPNELNLGVHWIPMCNSVTWNIPLKAKHFRHSYLSKKWPDWNDISRNGLLREQKIHRQKHLPNEDMKRNQITNTNVLLDIYHSFYVMEITPYGQNYIA